MMTVLKKEMPREWIFQEAPICSYPGIMLTERGWEWGYKTILLPFRAEDSLALDGQEAALACVLSAGCGHLVDPAVLEIFRKAARSYAKHRNPVLAQIILSWARLPRLEGDRASVDAAMWRLCAAETMLKHGIPPATILQAWDLLPRGLSPQAWQDWVKGGYNPDEPRDTCGRWCSAWGTDLTEAQMREKAMQNGGWLAPKDVAPENEKECVSLVRALNPGLPKTIAWRGGEQISEDNPPNLIPGTAIATFINGRYPQSGNYRHAATFLRYGRENGVPGIFVVDQYHGQHGDGQAAVRFLPFHKRPGHKDKYLAGAFSAIRKDTQ